jgi:long-chain acyl-CoA synthetase
VRSREGQPAQARFDRIVSSSPAFRPLRERLGDALWDLIDEKVRVVAGNCTLPLCGLGEDDELETVDAVIHFAGLTDFSPDPKDGVAANVQGALHAADLAARSAGKRLIHVSTAFVAGAQSGETPETLTPGLSPAGTRFDPAQELADIQRLCAETPGRRARNERATEHAQELGWPNLYTYTKALAEHLLAEREDIELSIVRPSIVECARRYPFPGWNEGINTSGPLVWLFSTSFRHFPSRKKNHFDVVPVDTVARGTMAVAAASLEDRAERIYQLASSDDNPLLFGRAIDLTNLGVRRMHDREGRKWHERWLLRHMDVTAVEGDVVPLTGHENMAKAAKSVRSWLGKVRLDRDLPPELYEKVGDRLEARISKMSRQLRKTERNMALVSTMLEMYRPFIYDHDYCFRTAAIRRLNERLPAEEAEQFRFDMDTLDWRHYWLHVQVPGLETWTLPELRGEKVPQDPPLPRPQAHAQPVVPPAAASGAEPPIEGDALDEELPHDPAALVRTAETGTAAG